MIRINNLRKCYGAIVAVDGISFEIGRGETFGLLGPNGAGKTTTIGMLCGLLKPDSGAIELDGKSDPTKPYVRHTLGVSPQSIALYDQLSAVENLAFFGKLYGLKGASLRERVIWALEFTGLAERGKHRVSTYSGGMKRRLNIACSLLHDPPFLFMDEPTVGVDPQSRNLIYDNIEHLKAQGRTILYTTHYIEEAQRLCDRVAIMDHGKILALDTVDGLIAAYGGSSLIEAEFDQPPDDPSKLPGNAVMTNNQVRIETAEPLIILARLMETGGQIKSLRVEHANLEDVFLNLTGRSLRD